MLGCTIHDEYGVETDTSTNSTTTNLSPFLKNVVIKIQKRHPNVKMTTIMNILLTGLRSHTDLLISSFRTLPREILEFVAKQINAEKNSKLLEETTQVQTTTPILLYLSPRMWWARADPVKSSLQCRQFHFISYLTSWITLGLYVSRATILLEMKKTQFVQEMRKLSVFAFFTVFANFLYAVVVSSCMELTSNCAGKSRTMFNFLWAPAVMMVHEFIISYEPRAVDPKIDGYVYSLKAAERPVSSWQDGFMRTHGGRPPAGVATDPDLAINEVPSPPTTWDEFTPTLQTAILFLCLVALAWIFSCGAV
jgi:hypothetical protein